MLLTALFTIAKSGNRPNVCHRLMNKHNVVYKHHGLKRKMQYMLYATICICRIIHAITWVSLQNIMLSKRSQTQKSQIV